VVHRPGVTNIDADGLSRNPCISKEDNTGVRWHGKVNEKMVPGWHASAFLCVLGVDSNMEGHVASYSSQRVNGHSSDPKVGDGSTGHHDVHDDTLVLEFLWTNMVPGMVSAKERVHVFQQARRGHIYSKCGRMIGCGLYHIQPREGVLCSMPMRSWGILE